MICDKCRKNSKCQKPYESDREYQLMYLGRTYTKAEWESDGDCSYFEKTETTHNKDCAVTSPSETTPKPDKSGFAQS